jgi:hypothetical protein
MGDDVVRVIDGRHYDPEEGAEDLRLPPRFHIVEHEDKIHGPGWQNRFRMVIQGSPITLGRR